MFQVLCEVLRPVLEEVTKQPLNSRVANGGMSIEAPVMCVFLGCLRLEIRLQLDLTGVGSSLGGPQITWLGLTPQSWTFFRLYAALYTGLSSGQAPRGNLPFPTSGIAT